MVVDDLNDDCKTLLCPSRFMDDIYRIWCCSRTVRVHPHPYDMYFENEYKQYVNDRIDFDGNEDTFEWIPDPKDAFQMDGDEDLSENDIVAALEDYYIAVVRTEDGIIQNERRYILPPTKVSDLFMQLDGDSGGDGYVKCNLSKWQSPNVRDGHHVVA